MDLYRAEEELANSISTIIESKYKWIIFSLKYLLSCVSCERLSRKDLLNNILSE